jgi:hypothetical protein
MGSRPAGERTGEGAPEHSVVLCDEAVVVDDEYARTLCGLGERHGSQQQNC